LKAPKYSRKGSFNMLKTKLTSPRGTPRQFTYKGAGGGI
jgi:hypothetical protein